MELDPIPYIFGSFARRRQSQDISSSKRRSVDQTVVSTTNLNIFATPSSYVHLRTRSAPQQNTVENSAKANSCQSMDVGIRNGSGDEECVETLELISRLPKLYTPPSLFPASSNSSTLANQPLQIANVKFTSVTSQLKCSVCFGHFLDPRVLPCLHTCCLRCLQELEARDEVGWEHDPNNISGSHNSGTNSYVSDKPSISDSNWSSPVPNRKITCPSCGHTLQLRSEGVNSLPPYYMLQHQMILNTLNSSKTKLLCDMCSSHVLAISRCTQCAINLCVECEISHKRQKSTSSHETLILEEARRRGIKKVRKQIMCVAHPENELSTFCSTCSQVLCKDCTTTSDHYQHSFESIAQAAKNGTCNVLLALDRAKSLAQKSSLAVTQLQSTAERIASHCERVEKDIDAFMMDYKDAVAKHHQELICQVQKAKDEKIMGIVVYTLDLQKQVREARDVATFADELLREAEPVEVLTFSSLIKDRVEDCVANRYAENGSAIRDLRLSENLRFLPQELVTTNGGGCPLYGVVSTQTVDPQNCSLNIHNIKNLKVGRRVSAILKTRDRNNKRMQHGGESSVLAQLHQRDGGFLRRFPVAVEDLRNGTYSIEFTRNVAGKIMLMVYIKGLLIKDGPIAIWIRSLRPHQGIFHCCTFCSSSGGKEACCGCPGRMPGGYRGCGHGHEGHPGRRHWSCCGNVVEQSECARNNAKVQQFTL